MEEHKAPRQENLDYFPRMVKVPGWLMDMEEWCLKGTIVNYLSWESAFDWLGSEKR